MFCVIYYIQLIEALYKAFKIFDDLFYPIVVAKTQTPGKLLSERIKEVILAAQFFISILTRSSITNQWVNQEIGYGVENDKTILHPVEHEID